MNRNFTLTMQVVLALVLLPLLAGAVSVNVDIGVFHDALAPYGDWVETERFGAAWCPSRVDHGWRPYTNGHWVYTDVGWTWMGNDEWGWATDHYGRWTFDPAYGWIWVPGSQWAPAWVAWRSGGGYVGWAPLPPEVGVDMAGVNFDAIIDPLAFTFVADRFLVELNLGPHIFPVARNVTYVHVTNNITNYTIVENRVVNRGVEVGWIEKASRRPIPRLQVRSVETVDAVSRGRVRGAEVAFYRPAVGPARGAAPAPAPRSETRPVDETLARAHSREAVRLQATEDRERRALVRTHEKEERRAPPGAGLEDLRARHAAEIKAQGEHEQRERQVLQARQQRERGSGPPPARDKHRH